MSKFVSDGKQRLLNSPAIQARIAEAEKRIQAAYADRLTEAWIGKRLYLEIKIRYELRKEIEKIAPSDALYLESESQPKR